MGKNSNTEISKVSTGSIGAILGSLLGDGQKEIRFEIVCKVVDADSESPAVTTSTRTADIVYDDNDIPRPLSQKGRIDGINALARFLQCAPSTAQRMKNEGRIPFYQRGTRIYFYDDDVLRALAQKPQCTGSAGGGIIEEQTKFATKFTPCSL